MRRWFGIILVVLAAGGRAGAAPVGMACQVKGSAQVRSGAAAWKPLRLLQRVAPGDTVRCGAGAEAVIVLFDSGARYKIAAGHQGVVGAKSVAGAAPLGGLSGPSGRVAKALGGSRSGAFMARPALSHKRLMPDSPGWLAEGERHFAWQALPNAAAYSFTLFDQNDNVLWSERGADTGADYPADLTALATRRPFVWRIIPFGQSGKPLPESRWGVVTFLSKADADQLSADAAALQQQADANAGDPTPLVLLADLYQQYGVMDRTLEILENLKISGQLPADTADAALADAYRQISPYAQVLARPAAPADESGE